MSIEEKKHKLDKLRPLSQKSLESLDAALDIELTYSSNAIEGNTLTLQETAIVLEKGITVRGKPLKDHQEAVDHFDALKFVRKFVRSNDAITEDQICNIHRLVVASTLRDEAGQYSQFQRRIMGSNVVFPNPAKVPALLDELGKWLETSPSDYKTAFDAHLQLVSIHPFSDGNGRTARLLMNLVLFRGGYPPVAISPEQRLDYIESIEKAQLSDDKGEYYSFMETQLDKSLKLYLEHIDPSIERNNNLGIKSKHPNP